MKAFGVLRPEEPVGDQAMQAYLDSFQTLMTEARIKAMRMLTSLDSRPALAAAAQIAAGQEMVTKMDELVG